MANGPFPFLRATFYRWLQRWRKECRQLDAREGDVLLAIGDLHLENFGVWRDSRGRVVWGVVDYDEACQMPFTIDLVRLATSISLAGEVVRSSVALEEIAKSLISGYEEGLGTAGAPIFVSERGCAEMTDMVSAGKESQEEFWARKLNSKENPAIRPKELPRGLEDIFCSAFARDAKPTYLRQRKPGGLGSLGRRRYTAFVCNDDGHPVAREAKALVPSAVHWLEMRPAAPSMTSTLLQRVVRSPDPLLQVHDRWLVRQLVPDTIKLEISVFRSSVRPLLTPDLIRAMGFESANIHLGSKSPAELHAALARLTQELGRDWLRAATERMEKVTREDHSAWMKHWNRHRRSSTPTKTVSEEVSI